MEKTGIFVVHEFPTKFEAKWGVVEQSCVSCIALAVGAAGYLAWLAYKLAGENPWIAGDGSVTYPTRLAALPAGCAALMVAASVLLAIRLKSWDVWQVSKRCHDVAKMWFPLANDEIRTSLEQIAARNPNRVRLRSLPLLEDLALFRQPRFERTTPAEVPQDTPPRRRAKPSRTFDILPGNSAVLGGPAAPADAIRHVLAKYDQAA